MGGPWILVPSPLKDKKAQSHLDHNLNFIDILNDVISFIELLKKSWIWSEENILVNK